MCLAVLSSHYWKKEGCKPRTCEKDILVFKSLLPCVHRIIGDYYSVAMSYSPSNTWVTSCRQSKVEFKDGKAVLETDCFGLRQVADGSWRVDEGIHACQSHGACKTYGGNVFYAVIPQGTEYYMGRFTDIVSKKLLIFESQDEFLKYRETHDVINIGEQTTI